jgi:hypothetical protein
VIESSVSFFPDSDLHPEPALIPLLKLTGSLAVDRWLLGVTDVKDVVASGPLEIELARGRDVQWRNSHCSASRLKQRRQWTWWRSFPPLAAHPRDWLGARQWGVAAAVNLVTRAPDPTSSLYCAVRWGPTNLERLDAPIRALDQGPARLLGWAGGD